MIDQLKRHALVYVATPYSKYPGGTQAAFEDASAYAGRLLKAGVTVFSPIAHSHPLAVFGGIDGLNHDFWLGFDETFMRASDALCVVEMDGWEESHGVAREISFFRKQMKPVYFIKPGQIPNA